MELRVHDVRNVFSSIGIPESPGVDDSGAPKPKQYRGRFIMAPTHEAAGQIDAITKSLLTDKYGAKAQEIYKQMKVKNCLLIHSGEEQATRSEYEGMVYFGASAKLAAAPRFVHKVPKKPDGSFNLIAPGEIALLCYGGSYVNVQIDIWIYDFTGHDKRVCAKMLGVQPLRDGDPFQVGRASQPDDWDDVSTGEEKQAAATGGAW